MHDISVELIEVCFEASFRLYDIVKTDIEKNGHFDQIMNGVHHEE